MDHPSAIAIVHFYGPDGTGRALASPHDHPSKRRKRIRNQEQMRSRSIREQGARRSGLGADRGAGGHRRQGRSVQGDGRGWTADPRRAGEAHRHERALRARVAVGAGGGRLRHLRRQDEPLCAAGRARGGAGRRGEPGLRAGRVPGHDVGDAGRAEGRRGVPARPWRRLARARPGAVHRHRAILPPRLQRASGERVDSGAATA